MHRSYYCDAETELYYLQSRYYSPELGRFINSDIAVSTGQGLIGCNTFAYCGNNPVTRSDNGGATWETVWDIISLGSSILDVAMNPADPWAWLGLAGDLIDVAVPFVGGLGEATRAANVALNVTEALDDAHDVSKVIDDLAEATIDCDGLCFVAGTEVLVEDGTKNIECVQTGDLVWAWDEPTGNIELKKVVETYVSKTYELLYVYIEGEEIIATPSHPFYTVNKGWTLAINLCAGDVLSLRNGNSIIVQAVKYEHLEQPIMVFNFQVDDYHTYFVGKNGTLVHNQCLLDDVLEDAVETTSKKGITRNFEKLGGYEQAYSDFLHLAPSDVKKITTQYGDGLMGILPADATAILRPGSRTGGITLEIQISSRKRIKIRY